MSLSSLWNRDEIYGNKYFRLFSFGFLRRRISLGERLFLQANPLYDVSMVSVHERLLFLQCHRLKMIRTLNSFTDCCLITGHSSEVDDSFGLQWSEVFWPSVKVYTHIFLLLTTTGMPVFPLHVSFPGVTRRKRKTDRAFENEKRCIMKKFESIWMLVHT